MFRNECDNRILKFVARKADLLFCKTDAQLKSRTEDAQKRESTTPLFRIHPVRFRSVTVNLASLMRNVNFLGNLTFS